MHKSAMRSRGLTIESASTAGLSYAMHYLTTAQGHISKLIIALMHNFCEFGCRAGHT